MGSTETDGLRYLKDVAAHLQSARVSRRTLLKAGGGAIAALPLAAAPVAPGSTVLAQGLAPNTALVTSLRLPLSGIGNAQVAPLLQGDYANWTEIGCPVPLPVTLFEVETKHPEGTTPAEVLADYNALCEKLDETPGGFAMLPIEMIDPRVNTLDIDGVSPLLLTGADGAPIVRIGVAGDIIFGRHGGDWQREFKEPSIPLWPVKGFLSTFDVTVANFECFVSETRDIPELVQPEGSVVLDFVTRPDSLEGMVMAGIDSVTMANNHAVFPFGVEAMTETMGYLNDAGITPWGVGQDLDEARAPWTTEVNGTTIAFYGIDGVTGNLEYPTEFGVQTFGDVPVDARAGRGGTNPLKLDQNLADIEKLAGEYDIVLPYIHMGDQYLWTPRRWVVETCRKYVDAGATAVLTSHPHATMGMEIYKGKPIFYSIGNFVYDQGFSVETRQGYFLELTFRGKTLAGFRIHPTGVLNQFQPRFRSGLESAGFMDRFWRSVDLTRQKIGYDPAVTRPA